MYQIFVNKNLKIKIILLYHIILMLFVLQKHLDISTLISEVEMYTKGFICLRNYMVLTIMETKN